MGFEFGLPILFTMMITNMLIMPVWYALIFWEHRFGPQDVLSPGQDCMENCHFSISQVSLCCLRK